MEDLNLLALKKALNEANMNEKDQNFVIQVYEWAAKMHQGQTRESGEPYINHPVSSTLILIKEMKCYDKEAIAATLLHDVVEECANKELELYNGAKFSPEEILEIISNRFGPNVAALVDGVTKMDKLSFTSKEEKEIANLQKLISEGTDKDIRIFEIKLADRLDNMRTLKNKKNKYKQAENAKETLDIFVPLAHYLGIDKIKRELEDLAYRYLYPCVYNIITKNLKEYVHKEKGTIAYFCSNLTYHLTEYFIDKSNIPDPIRVSPIKLRFQLKTIPEIDRSLNQRQTLSEIHDLKQVRLIFDDIETCYEVFNLLQTKYVTAPHKKKDYIANPKLNLYQALHITILGPNNSLFHIQIMTEQMANINEYGLMSFCNNPTLMQKIFNEKFAFFKDIRDSKLLLTPNPSEEGIIKETITITDKAIKIYDQSRNSLYLPLGSTIIDYAYNCLKSYYAHFIIKAIVNGVEVPFNYQLAEGDNIQLIYSKNAPGPSAEWLKYCITNNAKEAINDYQKEPQTVLTITQ